MTKYIVVLGVILIGLVGWQAKRISNLKDENKRLDGNQTALLGKVDRYKTKDSLNVLSVDQLSLQLKEFKKFRSSDLEIIEKLNVDIKRLKSINTTQIQTKYVFKDVIRDSLIFVSDTIVDTVKVAQFKDEWLEFKGILASSGAFTGTIISKDSLVYVEHIVPKKFLFFKFGVKSRKQEILSKNPHTKILNSEFVKILE